MAQNKRNDRRSITVAAEAAKLNARQIRRAAKGINAYSEAAEGLTDLNTMRGGPKGFKGFVMEEMEAAEASARGRVTQVLNNNGVADLRHIKVDGSEALKQMKAGYRPGQIDFARYKGQTVTVDKGNPYFQQFQREGAKYGVKVVEGHVTANEAKRLAEAMQLETKITGAKSAVVVPKLYQGARTISSAHGAGISAARTGAMGGAGFSIGSNLVQVAKGNKSVGEAARDVAIDTAKAGVTSYAVGAGASLLSSTAAGAAALETAAAAGAALSGAPIIGTVVTAGGAAASAIGGAAATATATALGAVGASAAITAVGVAAAPVVAVGAVVGGLFSLFSD